MGLVLIVELTLHTWICQVPNAIGIVLGLLQLIVYSIYKNKSPIPSKSVEMTAEDGKENKAKESTNEQDLEQGSNDV